MWILGVILILGAVTGLHVTWVYAARRMSRDAFNSGVESAAILFDAEERKCRMYAATARELCDDARTDLLMSADEWGERASAIRELKSAGGMARVHREAVMSCLEIVKAHRGGDVRCDKCGCWDLIDAINDDIRTLLEPEPGD